MTIQIGGQQFTEAEVIAAIAASNDADHTHTVSAYSSLDEVSGVLQAVLHRLAALEDRLPESPRWVRSHIDDSQWRHYLPGPDTGSSRQDNAS